MRLVCIPEELTALDLLDLSALPFNLAALLAGETCQHIRNGQFDDALSTIASAQVAVATTRDRHAAALIHIYTAEVYRRELRWEDALDQLTHALHWLGKQVTQPAVHNLAVAQSLVGLIHFVFRADDKAFHAFTRAQTALVESERYWSFGRQPDRVAACQNLARWMAQLLDLRSRLPLGEFVMLIPVYELLADYTPIRTGVLDIQPYQVVLPPDTLVNALPANLIPVQLDALPFLQLRPDAQYLALKVPAAGDFVRYSRAGDTLLVEAVTPVPLTRAAKLGPDASFVRQTNGRIHFSQNSQETEGFVGIPRVLIREEEDEDERE